MAQIVSIKLETVARVTSKDLANGPLESNEPTIHIWSTATETKRVLSGFLDDMGVHFIYNDHSHFTVTFNSRTDTPELRDDLRSRLAGIHTNPIE